jgi:hypothetical protein
LFVINCNEIQFGNRGNRYTDVIKKLAAFVYIRGGKALYQFLRANLKLPELSGLIDFMRTELSVVRENTARFDELKSYLESHNYPLEVHLFEDGTKVVEKIDYCPTTNTLIGLDAPFDETGFPIQNYHLATSAKHIYNSVASYAKSSYSQIILAQPNVSGKKI